MKTKPSALSACPWYPFLLVAWPILDFYARNSAEAFLSDVLTGLALFLGAAITLFVATRLLVRNSAKAGLVVALAAVLFFTYSELHRLASSVNGYLNLEFLKDRRELVQHQHLMTALSIVFVLAAAMIVRSRRNLSSSTRPLNLVAALLVGFALGRIGLNMWPSSSAGASSTAVVPQARGQNTQVSKAKPDIYYIVLDRYGSQETLRTAYDFENRSFLDRLRGMGFHVAEASRCNYAKSSLSIWSCLNMRYVRERAALGDIVDDLVAGHAVDAFLQSRGYDYLQLGSWYSPTRACRAADQNINCPPREFMHALLKQTPLAHLLNVTLMEEADHRGIALFQLKKLAETAARRGPKFVFAHILLPHPPFVFARDGSSADMSKSAKERYVEQLRFTNSKMLECLEILLERSAVSPVIVLQADEGPALRGDDAERTMTERRKIRTGILAAVRLPGGHGEVLYDTITPVNTFRVVLREIFGASLEPLEDRVYDWGEGLFPSDQVFEFEDITGEVRG